ncbi:MAG: TetR/AcrR family transcriptional regulator [Candidatus Bipolaricaulota bacterium]|nr:TetR/AcrR family transcriptional regulator [Candidatus Bipolaricaulota bacterium]
MNDQPRLEERITKAAERLFAQEGFAATGMRAIAQLAKVSIGAIYHHFSGKEEILEQIVREEIERRQEFLEGLRQRGLPLKEQIQGLVKMHFTLLQERSDVARLFFRERFDPSSSLGTKIQDLYGNVASYVAEIIKQGITAGEIRPCSPLLTAYEILGMVETVSLRALGEDETAAKFRNEGPQELATSLWLWLLIDREGERAHA